MLKKLMVISMLAVLGSVFGLTKSAYAHFLLEDTRTGVKAIFHVTPDHDPIAGKESVISFDFSKTGFETKNYSYSLKVKSTKGDAASVPVDVTGNVVLANYTFPSQGFYDIILVATHKQDGSESKLQYGQRVSRGTIIQQSEAIGPVEIGVIAGAVLVAVGAMFFGLKDDSIKRKGKQNETSDHE